MENKLVNMTSLFQYELSEMINGPIDEVIKRLQEMKKSEPGYNIHLNAHVYDDSFGGINEELEFYGELKEGWHVVYPKEFNEYGIKCGKAEKI